MYELMIDIETFNRDGLVYNHKEKGRGEVMYDIFLIYSRTMQNVDRQLEKEDLYSRVGQHIYDDFIIRQVHLPPKVPKQANIRGSLQKQTAEIE